MQDNFRADEFGKELSVRSITIKAYNCGKTHDKRNISRSIRNNSGQASGASTCKLWKFGGLLGK